MDAWSGFGQPGRARVFVNGGWVSASNGPPRPANVTPHLENTKFRRAFKIGWRVRNGFYVFDGQKSTTAVLILESRHEHFGAKADRTSSIEMEDLFGNPSDGEKTETLLFLRGTSPEMITVLLKDLETLIRPRKPEVLTFRS